MHWHLPLVRVSSVTNVFDLQQIPVAAKGDYQFNDSDKTGGNQLLSYAICGSRENFTSTEHLRQALSSKMYGVARISNPLTSSRANPESPRGGPDGTFIELPKRPDLPTDDWTNIESTT